MTTATMPKTTKEVEAMMAAKLNETLGIRVEVTCRYGADRWTICGPDRDARKAADYLAGYCDFRLEDGADSIVHDDELGETFIYMMSK
jgi:hypothetical protein